jgi:hypothetical protein
MKGPGRLLLGLVGFLLFCSRSCSSEFQFLYFGVEVRLWTIGVSDVTRLAYTMRSTYPKRELNDTEKGDPKLIHVSSIAPRLGEKSDIPRQERSSVL